jgi:coenzyme F420-reducing hydrogenase alpha subunit
MQTITLEPLRWQEDPSRIIVHANDSRLDVYYQVTSPKFAEIMCCGRPVEELPRILPILGPAHHLAAALALDRSFQVAPPELAQTMRTALLQAQYCSAHLRKIYFLLTSLQDPFADLHAASRSARPVKLSKRILESIMHHAALAQEAEDILGGRRDQPLTAVAGGVSRYLKEDHLLRLAAIGEVLTSYGCELAEFMRGEVLAEEGALSAWADIEIPALAGLCLDAAGKPLLGDAQGGAPQSFGAEQVGERIALQYEAWTYQPFAYLQEKGWQGIEQSEGLFFVGPLARFNCGQAAGTPLAEEERQRLIERFGAPPVYKVMAAYGALAVELIQAAETLQQLCVKEKLTGPTLRTLPAVRAGSAWAALETPQGLAWHQYQVDDEGLVQAATIIDARAANNGVKCMLARQLVTEALQRNENPAWIKEKAAVALLPF